jgi:hypothetical protein
MGAGGNESRVGTHRAIAYTELCEKAIGFAAFALPVVVFPPEPTFQKNGLQESWRFLSSSQGTPASCVACARS